MNAYGISAIQRIKGRSIRGGVGCFDSCLGAAQLGFRLGPDGGGREQSTGGHLIENVI